METEYGTNGFAREALVKRGQMAHIARRHTVLSEQPSVVKVVPNKFDTHHDTSQVDATLRPLLMLGSSSLPMYGWRQSLRRRQPRQSECLDSPAASLVPRSPRA